jgi:hypothetical protein
MSGLAEKIGFIGCDNIKQVNRFKLLPFLTEQKVAVFRHGSQPQSTHSLGQATFNHGLFRLRQTNAQVVINKSADTLEIILIDAHLHNGPLNIYGFHACCLRDLSAGNQANAV